jgi:tetratricopeptide (TPR) repeat protein
MSASRRAWLVGALVALGVATVVTQSVPPRVEATSLFGRPLVAPSVLPNQRTLEGDLRTAETEAAAKPDDPEAIIWLGRRQAYLWRFQDSIATFGRGITRWPDNPKFYRHRGHRFITTRQFARAQEDFERAVSLVRGKSDEVEPDGAPNAAGVPRSTLQFNIWYHLGLARYLQGNYQGAYEAYVECMKVSTNDDSIVATSDWMWMTLMRLGRKADAARVLERIMPTMDILENGSYHRRLLMYKGLERPESLLNLSSSGPAASGSRGVGAPRPTPSAAGATTAVDDATTIATQGYGVGNYYFVNGDRAQAQRVFERVVAGTGWSAFGFIAAEADLQRMP